MTNRCRAACITGVMVGYLALGGCHNGRLHNRWHPEGPGFFFGEACVGTPELQYRDCRRCAAHSGLPYVPPKSATAVAAAPAADTNKPQWQLTVDSTPRGATVEMHRAGRGDFVVMGVTPTTTSWLQDPPDDPIRLKWGAQEVLVTPELYKQVHVDFNTNPVTVQGARILTRNGTTSASPPAPPSQPQHDRAYLGLGLEERNDGLYVTHVVVGSPAHEALLAAGDRVLLFGDRALRSQQELADALAARYPGQSVVVRIDRGGWQRDVAITLGRPTTSGQTAGPPEPVASPAPVLTCLCGYSSLRLRTSPRSCCVATRSGRKIVACPVPGSGPHESWTPPCTTCGGEGWVEAGSAVTAGPPRAAPSPATPGRPACATCAGAGQTRNMAWLNQSARVYARDQDVTRAERELRDAEEEMRRVQAEGERKRARDTRQAVMVVMTAKVQPAQQRLARAKGEAERERGKLASCGSEFDRCPDCR